MAKTPEELEQIHEHNRNVLRELQFDSTRWLPVPQAIRALVPVFGPALLQAAAKLHERMRSPGDAIPTATRWCRWRDGLQTSHVVTRYPAAADWDAVSPESLLMGFREVSEGDGNVVRCWDFVDLQHLNRWLSALAEPTRQAALPEIPSAPVRDTPVRGKPGPKEFDFWSDMFRHLETVAADKKFDSAAAAAREGARWLEENHKSSRTDVDYIRIKLGEQPGLLNKLIASE